MKVTPVNHETLPRWRARIERVSGASQRQWGTMTPAAMLAHLRRTVELSLGEVEYGPDASNFFSRTRFARWFAFKVMPWPRGKIKAPSNFFPESVGDVTTECRELLSALQRFVETERREPHRVMQHPLFGKVELREFEFMHGRHIEHHMQQFGV